MKQSLSLAKGLTEAQIKTLQSEVKHSVLGKQLRSYIKDRMNSLELTQEDLSKEITDIYATIGERRGLRSVLKLIPEEL